MGSDVYSLIVRNEYSDIQAGEWIGGGRACRVSLCDALLAHDLHIEHACEKSCACTTCHVIVRQGFDTLDPSEEKEDDMLDKAWGLEPLSRLSCQVRLKADDLIVEIPKYTINLTKEGKR